MTVTTVLLIVAFILALISIAVPRYPLLAIAVSLGIGALLIERLLPA